MGFGVAAVLLHGLFNNLATGSVDVCQDTKARRVGVGPIPERTMRMSTPIVSPPAVISWRSIYPVHPCADVFPMMTDLEIDELAADIKANGLRQPVLLYMENGTNYVLDGRNRVEAMMRAGIPLERSTNWDTVRDPATVDPAALVIGLN